MKLYAVVSVTSYVFCIHIIAKSISVIAITVSVGSMMMMPHIVIVFEYPEVVGNVLFVQLNSVYD